MELELELPLGTGIGLGDNEGGGGGAVTDDGGCAETEDDMIELEVGWREADVGDDE